MSISGKLPDNLTQNPSSNPAIDSEKILDELPDKFSNDDPGVIQSTIFVAFDNLMTFHYGEFSDGQGEFRVADTSFERIEEFITTYTSQYQRNSDSKKYLESLIGEISENDELRQQWSLSIHNPAEGRDHSNCDFKLSQFGFTGRGGKNFITLPESTGVVDLPPGSTTRERPMLCIFLEDPSKNFAGIPIYNDNGIPIVIIGFYLPPGSLPSAYIDTARPGIDIQEEEI